MLKQVAEGLLVHRSVFIESNAIVVDGQDGVLLIDPGVTDAELVCLVRDLDELGRPVVAGFSTHPDWDHLLWHDGLGDVPRFGTARCAATAREALADPEATARIDEHLAETEIAGQVPFDGYGRIQGLPEGASEVPWAGPRARIIEHRAHAPGHAALLIEERGVLVAGDMLSDVLVPMLDIDDPDDPVEAYLVALRALEDAAVGADVVVPGHGGVGGRAELRTRIAADRAYVLALRDGDRPSDPRIGPSVRPGWEWVIDVHEGQAQQLSGRHQRGGAAEHPG